MKQVPSAYALNSGGLPELRLSFVLVMDVLGFADQIMEAPDANDLLHRYWKATIDIWRDLTPPTDHRQAWAYKAYVDNVLIGAPISGATDPVPDGESQFGFVSNDAAWTQLNLATRGWIVRGAITLGDVFIGEDLAFGAPIVEAHDLERSAKFPRVVVSDKVIALSREHIKYYSDGSAPHHRALLSDGSATFVNYLHTLIDGSVGEEANVEDGLDAHKREVVKALQKAQAMNKTSVVEKYQWLAGYHNYFVESLYGRFARFKIPTVAPLELLPFK